MKRLIFTIGIAWFALVNANQEWAEPAIPPDVALTLVLEFLANDHPGVDLSRSNLISLNFDHVDGHWSAFFECKEIKLSCHFSVGFSNKVEPEYIFYPGM